LGTSRRVISPSIKGVYLDAFFKSPLMLHTNYEALWLANKDRIIKPSIEVKEKAKREDKRRHFKTLKEEQLRREDMRGGE
jgi:hypothetical protein